MRHVRNLTFVAVVLACTFPGTVALAAQELVERLGSRDALQVEGAKSFPVETLRKGLRWDLDFLLAAHPAAPLTEYLAVIEKRLTRGYHSAGFPDARVNSRVDATTRKIIVQVSEGPRYTCGEIRVTGARKVPANFVTNWLYEARLREPTNDFGFTWSNSLPASFTEFPRVALASIVTNAFMDLGFARPKFDLQLTPDPKRGVADFVVNVRDEGPRMIIGEIDVLGAKTNSVDSIIKFLGAKTGTPVHADLIRGLNARLRESGRFLKHIVRLVPSADSAKALLEIEVEELDTAPPLDRPFTSEQVALLKTRDWAVTNAIQREDLTFVLALDSVHPSLRSNRLELILSHGGVLLNLDTVSNNLPPQLQYSLWLRTNSFNFASARRQRKLLGPRTTGQVRAYLTMEPEPDPKPGARFNLGVGGSFTSTRKGNLEPLAVDLSLAPAAFVDLAATQRDNIALRNGVLSITNEGWSLALDAASGRPRSIDYEGVAVLRFSVGAFEEATRRVDDLSAAWPNDWNQENPLTSISAFAVRELLSAQWVSPANSSTNNTVSWLHALSVLNGLPWQEIVAPLTAVFPTGDGPPEQDFSVPPDLNALGSGDISRIIALLVVPMSDQLFDEQSWPWTLAREITLMFAGKGRYTQQELERIQASDSSGPFACLAAARLLKVAQPSVARSFAITGIARQSSRLFRQDCAVLLDARATSGQIARRLLAAISKLDDKEIATLGAVLDPESRTLLQSVHRLYRARKDEPIAELLGPALETYWDNFLKEKVRQELRSFLAAR